ncbi:MAG: hypothetical protein SGI83_07280 [Bacteroidota bacterium]|nr:hypothetical protein [Bacteroidota bacterium]
MKNSLFITAFLLISIVTVAKNDKLRNGQSVTLLEGNMFFSNQPFTTSSANSKNSFTSAGYIYGRIELLSGTIKEAFKIKEDERTLLSLIMRISI